MLAKPLFINIHEEQTKPVQEWEKLDTKYISFNTKQNKYRVQRNGKYYGAYSTIGEAKRRKLELIRNGWKHEYITNPKWKFIRRGEGGQSYQLRPTINGKSNCIWSCHVPEYALYMRDKLVECDWDLDRIPEFEAAYPEYYTDTLRFYQDIHKHDNKYKVVVKDSDNKLYVAAVCTKLEDALWERDLYYEYGEDAQSWAEDTRPNPYYDMELPYWLSRRPSGGLRKHKDYKKEFDLFQNIILEYPEICNLGQLSKYVDLTEAMVRKIFKEFNLTFKEAKDIVESGEDIYELVKDNRPKQIIQPDLSYHLSSTDYIYKEGDGWIINRKREYFGKYSSKKLAKKVVTRLKKCGWDKKELPRIQKELGHQSMVNSKRWVYPCYRSRKTGEVTNWCIRHKNKDKKMINYGTYKDYEYACIVRDYLIEYDWDKDKLSMIQEKARKERYFMSDENNLCKCCKECETFVYERINRKGGLETFQYCKGNKEDVEKSNWYITKDGYAYSTKRLEKGKKKFFHTLQKKNPNNHIDHQNGVRFDNRLCNLREVTESENQQNKSWGSDRHSSKFPGVCWNSKEEKWVTIIRFGKQGKYGRYNLGRFDCEEEAYHHYVKALEIRGKKVNTMVNDGETWKQYKRWLAIQEQSTLDDIFQKVEEKVSI